MNATDNVQASPSPMTTNEGLGGSILVVDDILENRELLQRRLERKGYRLVSAGGGAEALAILEQQAVDLVLLDLMMPEVDGMQVLRHIRTARPYHALPVIMVTAKSDSADIVNALKEGANDFVSKPIDFQVLFARVKTQLALKSAHDGLNELNRDLERRVQDRTAQIAQAHAALQRGAERYRILYDDTPAMFYTVDIRGKILSVNRFALAQLGYEIHELVGHSISCLCHHDDRQRLQDELSGCFAVPAEVHRWLVQRVRKDGSCFWSRETARVVSDDQGVEMALVVAEDITESHRLSEQLSYQASHDPLTDLTNRREFERRLQRVLVTAQAEDTHNALLYLDLDQFKVVNDTCGHAAGDELLRQLSRLLTGRVRKRDTLARLGGDEFGLLMEHCGLDEARRVADTLRRAVDEFRFVWGDHVFGLGISIGLVRVGRDSAGLASALADADAACFLAKEMGRNKVHVFEPDDEALAKRQGEMRWHPRIQESLDGDRFVLYRQDIEQTAGANDSGHCYELLVRMRDHDDNHIPPGAFLPAAERYGLAPKLDRWIIRRAFDWLQANPDHVEHLCHCGINLSGLSMNDEEMLPFIAKLFERTALPPERICFEVTETAAIYNLASATRFIKALKDLGCRFALDDFGSGLSSFAYLKSLPVDYLKIDGMFVRDILSDEVDFAMVRSINEIGKVMGKRTIAEFVENDEIRRRLQAIGVDYVQGYGIAKPELLIG